MYVDDNKKRTDTWLRALGLQLPVGLTTYGSIGNVTYYDDVVKKQEAKGSTALERAFEKANAKKGNEIFSLSAPVEETKDLVALHNLTPEKLLKKLDLYPPPFPAGHIT